MTNHSASQPGAELALGNISAASRRLLPDNTPIIHVFKPGAWSLLVRKPVRQLVFIALISLMLAFAPRLNLALTLLVPGLVIFVLIDFVWELLVWRSTALVLTENSVMKITGVLTQHTVEIHLDKVQHAVVRRTVIQRLLGIGDVGFASAGTAVLEQVWSDIPHTAQILAQIRKAQTKLSSPCEPSRESER